jgi:hypothetical protein
MTDAMPSRPATCPRFDECDPRCSARLTLGHLDEVFRVCHSDYESCPLNACGPVLDGTCDGGRDAARHESREVEHAVRFASCDGPLADERDAIELAHASARTPFDGGPQRVALTIGGRVA